MKFFAIKSLSLLCAVVVVPVGASTLEDVQERGVVRCGVSEGRPGFSQQNAVGRWRGIDVDVCRAVAAAALGDSTKVEYVTSNLTDRISLLADGKVDVLAHNTTWTFSRDTGQGVHFVGVNFFDGQGFMVKRDRGLRSALELDGASICVTGATTSELNLKDYFTHNRMAYRSLVFDSADQALRGFEEGRCDALTGDQSGLYGFRTLLKEPLDAKILPEFISKEPLSPAVATGDAQWFNIVRWSMFVMIEAEELGINSFNVSRVRKQAKKPSNRRLLGVEGEYGQSMGLDSSWAYRVISQVGNYGESFDRNLGKDSEIGMRRGQNALWSDGGLMYAPPMR